MQHAGCQLQLLALRHLVCIRVVLLVVVLRICGLTSLVLVCAGMYPGNRRIPFVTTIETHPPASQATIPIYRVMDEDGSIRAGAKEPTVDQATCVRMLETMLRLQALDSIFNDAQRQGRISFYMTNGGEEGIHIGSAMSWKDDDPIFAQYREAGVLLWRGYTLQNFADQVRPAACHSASTTHWLC